jgi:flavin-dependent dehydrogenase
MRDQGGAAAADAIRRVVILGGGAAGWITAGVLAARFPARGEDGISITLIESPDRPTIGVGEGTWPSIRGTLKQIGVSETEFLRACEASFKQGSRFVGWRDGTAADAYLHPFTLPVLDDDEILAAAARGDFEDQPFAAAVCFQAALCDQGRAPKAITMAEYAGAANYAYHLDAGKFGSFLRRHCVDKLGVEHRALDIVRVEAWDDGRVRSVVAADGAVVEGDLFVDCTGFASLLLGGHCGAPFQSCRDVLFVDRAWAVQLPHQSEDAPISPVTLSTAQSAGWIWDIGLTSRRGLGHVFASGYVSEDRALEELQAYVRVQGHDPDALSYRQLRIEPGRRREFWVGNCVAVGLSAGFIEPLEASAIALIELSAKMIADTFPRRRADLPRVARLFNDTFSYRWDRIIEFLKLHYALSARTDSPFWIDNRSAASIPDALAEKLAFWGRHCPGAADFAHRDEIFPAASHQYVLYGMGFRPEPSPWLGDTRTEARARERLAECARLARTLAGSLPAHRDLLARIQKFGLQKV